MKHYELQPATKKQAEIALRHMMKDPDFRRMKKLVAIQQGDRTQSQVDELEEIFDRLCPNRKINATVI